MFQQIEDVLQARNQFFYEQLTKLPNSYSRKALINKYRAELNDSIKAVTLSILRGNDRDQYFKKNRITSQDNRDLLSFVVKYDHNSPVIKPGDTLFVGGYGERTTGLIKGDFVALVPFDEHSSVLTGFFVAHATDKSVIISMLDESNELLIIDLPRNGYYRPEIVNFIQKGDELVCIERYFEGFQYLHNSQSTFNQGGEVSTFQDLTQFGIYSII